MRRSNVHSKLKLVWTTLLIVSTFSLSWGLCVLYFVLVCVDGCPFTYNVSQTSFRVASTTTNNYSGVAQLLPRPVPQLHRQLLSKCDIFSVLAETPGTKLFKYNIRGAFCTYGHAGIEGGGSEARDRSIGSTFRVTSSSDFYLLSDHVFRNGHFHSPVSKAWAILSTFNLAMKAFPALRRIKKRRT